MNFKVEEKEALTLIGFKETFTTVDGGENFDEITHKWANLTEEKMGTLVSLSNWKVQGFLGVSTINGGSHFDYTIATATDATEAQDMDIVTIPASTWAVFECVGPIPNAMMALKGNIPEWLTKAGYEQTAAMPRIEVYSNGDMSAADYHSEVWVPIKK